jgi:TMEM175 potassium channel family protein
MFPKARLDALNDGIFSVAMTLLVLDIRLPEEFNPADGSELLRALAKLWPKLLPYVLSFGVLGLRWLASIQIRAQAEFFSREYVNWWLFYLLLITFVPFSTIVVGRYAHLAPAIWLYAGHLLLIALLSIRMVALTPNLERADRLRRTMSAAFLAVSSLLALALSFVSPRNALLALALNFAQPVIERWRRRVEAKRIDQGGSTGAI